MALQHCDREAEAQNAFQCKSWVEMRQLPGVTNDIFFISRFSRVYSGAQAAIRLRHTASAFLGQRTGLLASAAEAEARRRVILTAIAVERFHVRHGAYPKSVAELAPKLVKTTPTDFIDGQPLRYSLTGNGHFLLYSIGLGCIDDGGKMPSSRHGRFAMPQSPRGGGAAPQSDIVWPVPAQGVRLLF